LEEGRVMLAEQPFLIGGGIWIPVRDGNKTALAIYDRHYTSRRAHIRKIDQFVGPGEPMVLLTPCARALFVWRKFKSDAGERGICCAVFRNEGAGRSSDLIRKADDLAFEKWPGERHYTYVDAGRIRSTNPGFCFLMAGWRRCGVSKKKKLVILERLP
jgi:hypothetical protein